jgi:hypothetical protein
LPPSLCTPSPPCHPSTNLADCWKCCTNCLNRSSSEMLFLFTLSGWTQHSCVSTSNSVLITSWSHSNNHLFMKFWTHSSGGKLYPRKNQLLQEMRKQIRKKWCRYEGN